MKRKLKKKIERKVRTIKKCRKGDEKKRKQKKSKV